MMLLRGSDVIAREDIRGTAAMLEDMRTRGRGWCDLVQSPCQTTEYARGHAADRSRNSSCKLLTLGWRAS
jgi:hypothetical protein